MNPFRIDEHCAIQVYFLFAPKFSEHSCYLTGRITPPGRLGTNRAAYKFFRHYSSSRPDFSP